MGIRSDTRDVNPTCTQMDEEKDVVGDQPKERPHFRGEEIGSNRRPVGTFMWTNSFQVVSPFRSETGGNPFRVSTLETVVSLTRCPRFFRAPEILSYPQFLFSRAGLRMSASISSDMVAVQNASGSSSHRTCMPPVWHANGGSYQV